MFKKTPPTPEQSALNKKVVEQLMQLPLAMVIANVLHHCEPKDDPDGDRRSKALEAAITAYNEVLHGEASDTMSFQDGMYLGCFILGFILEDTHTNS
jgi:hypothetical protein